MLTQDDIWFYFTDPAIQPETITQFMQGFTRKHLRFCVTTAYSRHHPAASSFVDNIDQLNISVFNFISWYSTRFNKLI